jgi:hypothetical protein
MIETVLRDNKLWAKTADLHLWELNPRSIEKKDFNRLLRQLFDLDQYKPSIITPDGLLLGGNMRRRGYDHILNKMTPGDIVTFYKDNFTKEITVEEAEAIQKKFEYTYVSIVNPQDENVKMKYNLSDNDSAGYTDLDLLSRIYKQYDIDYTTYASNYRPPENIQSVIDGITKATKFEIIVPCTDDADLNEKLAKISSLGIEVRQRKKRGSKDTIEQG